MSKPRLGLDRNYWVKAKCTFTLPAREELESLSQRGSLQAAYLSAIPEETEQKWSKSLVSDTSLIPLPRLLREWKRHSKIRRLRLWKFPRGRECLAPRFLNLRSNQ